VFDTCADGQTLNCLTVIDRFTRECLAIDVAGSIRSGRVIEVVTRLVSVHGALRYLRSDDGPEFVSRAVCLAYRTLHEFKAVTETTTGTGRSAAAPPRADQDEDRTEEPNLLTKPEGAILQ